MVLEQYTTGRITLPYAGASITVAGSAAVSPCREVAYGSDVWDARADEILP
jgi:hypothetical protein